MASPPTTSVPFPTIGDRGVVLPAESDILTGTLADINAAFANSLNITTLSTPQGQIASSEAAILGDSFAMFAMFVNLVDPAYSSGRMQDGIGRIYFISRIAGSPTVQACICSGLNGVIIPVGAIAQDSGGTLWVAEQQDTIVNGVVTINFACAINGPTAAPAGLTPYQTIPGWDSLTPTGAAVLGRNAETAGEFEARRSLSTGINSMGPLNAIYGAVAQLSDVLDVYTTQNNTGSPAVIGGVSVAANSIFVCVLGGTSAEIGSAIFSRKMPGCGMTGTTAVVVADPNPAYGTSPPQYTIRYTAATITNIAVVVTITSSVRVPSDALTQVQNAIIAAFAGLDGGPRAKIGSLVYASRYVAPIAGISNTFNNTTGQVIPGWSASIVSIKVGIDGAAASITGSIAGTTLNVTSVASGSLAVGYLIEGSGVTGGTTISALVGGTGGTGTYSVNTSQTVSSQALTATALADDVQMNIDQAPGASAANVYLNLV